MKKFKVLKLIAVVSVVFLSRIVLAGPPLANLEGTGGIAFNPVAYLADSGDNDIVGKPRYGAWYVNLSDVNVDWTNIGVADTFFKRLEVSYGFQTVNQAGTDERHKNNIGAKLLLLPENSFDSDIVPAISLGTVFKHTTNILPGLDSSGDDFYLVATKLLKNASAPVLLSGGVISSKAYTTGVFGYGDDRKFSGYGNIDVILPVNLITGLEYKQGPKYDGWHDSNYWDAHFAWTPNSNLTLVLAYVNAGDKDLTSKVGLGDGVVLSSQYAF